jgi:hypothetical protein
VGPIRRRRLRHRRQASITVRRVIGGWRANAVVGPVPAYSAVAGIE